MHADFAAKLRLTAAALGCDSRKAFCARFRAVNPQTQCEVDRLHKWMQGRAVPRGTSFYEDWRLVVGSGRKAAWFASCSAAEFAEELAHSIGLDSADLQARVGSATRTPVSPQTALGAQRTFFGAFACYSYAWSAHFRGKLIRGSLRIGPGRGAGAQAVYKEELITGTCSLSGEVQLTGGMIHIVLREGPAGPPVLLTLIAPGPPASALCGILAGPTLVSHAPAPSATRLAAVRVPEHPGPDEGNRYLPATAEAVSEDLHAAGLRVGNSQQVGDGLMEFLEGGLTQVALADQLLLCDLLDRAHIPGS